MDTVTDLFSPRRRAGVVLAVAGALVGLTGCGTGGAAPRLPVLGHELVRGSTPEAPLLATRASCDGRRGEATVAQRSRTALTRAELATVVQPFGGDPRRFADLALQTYCPSR